MSAPQTPRARVSAACSQLRCNAKASAASSPLADVVTWPSCARSTFPSVLASSRSSDQSTDSRRETQVFARGHSVLGQSPFTHVSRVQVPLEIHPQPAAPTPFEPTFPPTTVHPCDVALADLDGVVVVRPEQIDEVVQLARKGREVDERCRVDLLGGAGVKETFAKHRGK